jgi:vacuolar-type H+-ATPase subunit H
MKQIIEDVFQAEQKIDEILKQAREKAQQIKLSAEKTGADKVNEAKQKAREIIQEAIEVAKKNAENIRQDKLKQSQAEKDAILKKSDIIDKLVNEICNIILATECDTDGK